MAADLFDIAAPVADGDAPLVRWEGFEGLARDGRVVRIEISPITSRFIVVIPMHGKDVAPRRSCASIYEVHRAAEQVIRDTMPGASS